MIRYWFDLPCALLAIFTVFSRANALNGPELGSGFAQVPSLYRIARTNMRHRQQLAVLQCPSRPPPIPENLDFDHVLAQCTISIISFLNFLIPITRSNFIPQIININSKCELYFDDSNLIHNLIHLVTQQSILI